MPTTSGGLRYPAGSDTPNVPRDLQNLAEDVDTNKAPKASPALTGTPTAPTAAADTNTTQVATTAFVVGQAASVSPAMDGSAAVGTSSRYARADHVHASDTSRIATSLVTAKGQVVGASAASTPVAVPAATANGQRLEAASGETSGLKFAFDPVVLAVSVSDETTAITTGTAKVTFRMPFAMTVTAVRASLATASSSGNPTFDINEGGTSILGANKLSIDANEKTSTTAATATSISDSALADDAEITIDIDTAGTGAKGAKVYIIGTRA